MLSRFDVEFVRFDQKYKFVMFFDENKANHKTVKGCLSAGGFYEPDVSLFLMRCLRTGDVFIDVGANQGFFSLLGAVLVGNSGKVIACEPGTNNLADIERNIGGNAEVRNVTIVRNPVSNQSGPVSFFLNSDDSGGNALWDVAEWPDNRKSQRKPDVRVMESTKLDTLASTIQGTIRCIKIDTEGAEQLVLEGSASLLAQSRVDFIIAELHEFGLEKLGSSQMTLRNLMASYGYECYVLGWSGALPKHIPVGTIIRAPFIINLLFAKPASVASLFPEDTVDPRYF